MPLFSIVSVTLNNRPGLEKTRDSITLQGFRDFEWIVIDGSSDDGTQTAFASHALFFSEKDRGLYDAMNKGIEKATGEYLLFLNAGDILHEAATLQKIAEQIAKSKPDFIYGDSYEGGRYKQARPHTRKNWGMFTHHQSMLYAHKKIGALRYELNYKIGADYDFTCRFLKYADKVLYLPFAICDFEPGGISQLQAKQGRREQFTIRKNLETNFVVNAFIYTAQSMAWILRSALPGLYWKLKSSGNNDTGRAQT